MANNTAQLSILEIPKWLSPVFLVGSKNFHPPCATTHLLGHVLRTHTNKKQRVHLTWLLFRFEAWKFSGAFHRRYALPEFNFLFPLMSPTRLLLPSFFGYTLVISLREKFTRQKRLRDCVPWQKLLYVSSSSATPRPTSSISSFLPVTPAFNLRFNLLAFPLLKLLPVFLLIHIDRIGFTIISYYTLLFHLRTNAGYRSKEIFVSPIKFLISLVYRTCNLETGVICGKFETSIKLFLSVRT